MSNIVFISKSDMEYKNLIMKKGMTIEQFRMDQTFEKQKTITGILAKVLGSDIRYIEGAESVELNSHQGYMVPKVVVHKTRAPSKTVVIMIETAGIVPTGNAYRSARLGPGGCDI